MCPAFPISCTVGIRNIEWQITWSPFSDMPEKNLFETAVASLPKDDHRMRAWMAMVGCFTSVERTLRRRFTTVFRSSLPRYDVLTALTNFPDGLTMSQLASKLMVSKGNITGVVRRLQENQCVRQSTLRTDRRVQVVTLTSKGRDLWGRMNKEYRAVIEEVLSNISIADSRALTGKLSLAQEHIDNALQISEDAQ